MNTKYDYNAVMEMKKYYDQGKTMKEVAEYYNITAPCICRLFKKFNIEARTHAGKPHVNEQEIIDKYLAGKSSTEIAKDYDFSWRNVIYLLEKHGIKRDNRYKNVNYVKDYWENIDTYDKAYFLGFMITDGTVYKTLVRLGLQEQDKYILEKFAEKTNNENPIKGYRDNEACYNIKSQKWVDDLAKYGVIPNKTKYVYLPKLETEMMPHLIRGIIDGDGTITNHTGGYAISICGNKQMMTQVRDFLVETLGVYPVKVVYHKNSHVYIISWASKKDISLIGNYIYKDKQDCYLIRKYKKFLEILER